MDDTAPPRPPDFDDPFRDRLEDLFRWRRDVRRFRPDPVDEALIDELIGLAALAPSVGNSQPWRFVTVAEPGRRDRVIADFEARNKDALSDYDGEQAKLYASLKLAGLKESPAHLAVFADTETTAGHGLGQKTMPGMLEYSVVGAVTTLWLAARARGLGMGWVSILDPDNIAEILEVETSWKLIAYLCLGYPQEQHLDPELDRAGWQKRADVSSFVVRR
ncbi:MAG: 5,6-dimethylbenzimidazole synthase [Proteobacteria bacterium]|nr:5,6-dimethylbenzimidazole synthase [Pseudomonadota bacterium]